MGFALYLIPTYRKTEQVSAICNYVQINLFGLLSKKIAEKSNFLGVNLDLRSVMLMLAAKRIE